MKAKSSILTVVLSLFLVSGLFAQEKYEFAVVRIQGLKVAVATSANSSVQLFDSGKDDFDVALIKKIEELNAQGWEVYNTSVVANPGASYSANIYYLRKKKN